MKYLYYSRPDGIGFQYFALSHLLYIAQQLDLTILADWRNLDFFNFTQADYSHDQLEEYFRINHSRLIMDPESIDLILANDSSEVIGIYFARLLPIQQSRAPNIEFRQLSTLYPPFDIGTDCLHKHIELTGTTLHKYEKLSHIATESTGIHARLGNGEIITNIDMRDRMAININRFFGEMRKHLPHNFFVCTDSPAFLKGCIEAFGGKVWFMDRSMPAEDEGPGHRPGKIKAAKPHNPYLLISDAILEMLLLGQCHNLICNNSLFTYHARSCQRVRTTLLENRHIEYGNSII